MRRSGTGAETSMGMESSWFASFLEACLESAAGVEWPVWRVFKDADASHPVTPVTDRLDSDVAYEYARRLQSEEPRDSAVRYRCVPDPERKER